MFFTKLCFLVRDAGGACKVGRMGRIEEGEGRERLASLFLLGFKVPTTTTKRRGRVGNFWGGLGWGVMDGPSPLSPLVGRAHTRISQRWRGKSKCALFFASFFGGGKGFVYPNLVAGRSCLVDSVAFSDLMRISQAVPVSIVDGGGKTFVARRSCREKGRGSSTKKKRGGRMEAAITIWIWTAPLANTRSREGRRGHVCRKKCHACIEGRFVPSREGIITKAQN